jgi:two-component system, LytTR family, sensor histidine kinase LytS
MTDFNTEDNIIPKILKRRWMWHAAFWSVYFGVSLPSDIRMAMTVPEAIAKSKEATSLGIKITASDILLTSLTTSLTVIFFSYIIILFLYPIFFARQRYLSFTFWGVIIALLLNAVIVNLSYWIGSTWADLDWLNNYLSTLSLFALFLFLVTMCKFFKDNLIRQQIDNQRFREAKQAELDNLKAQLSPHFLFNTLNNFYGLAVTHSKQLPDLMLRLSDLMRYSLYETHLQTVPISDEIKYLKNYIELEKIRLEDNFKLDFSINKNAENQDLKYDILNKEIAPLILIVFVENAFKHARNLQNEPIRIGIELTALADNWLYFSVENNYLKLPASLSQLSTKKQSGLGLENVKRRLEALYPAHLHSLELINQDQFFKIKLKIKLDK